MLGKLWFGQSFGGISWHLDAEETKNLLYLLPVLKIRKRGDDWSTLFRGRFGRISFEDALATYGVPELRE